MTRVISETAPAPVAPFAPRHPRPTAERTPASPGSNPHTRIRLEDIGVALPIVGIEQPLLGTSGIELADNQTPLRTPSGRISLEDIGVVLPSPTKQVTRDSATTSTARSRREVKESTNTPVRKSSLRRLVGRAALLSAALTLASWVAPVDRDSQPTRSSERTAKEQTADVATTTAEIEESVTTTIPVAEAPINEMITPEEFLTPDGTLADPTYVLEIPSVGSRIWGYESPGSDGAIIGSQVNATAVDAVVPADTPQALTPQVAAYAAANPGFEPTATKTGRWYWGDAPAGAFQKTASHLHGYSVYPGQAGNSYFATHGSTKNAGGGDLPAQNIGDQMSVTYSESGNRFDYELADIEIIDVDDWGFLTTGQRDELIAQGYPADVTYGMVAQRWLGMEDVSTITIQICSDPEGNLGSSSARTLYRYKPVGQSIKLTYPAS